MAMPPPPPPMSQSRLEEGLRPGGPPPDEPVPIFIVCMDVVNTVTHLVLGAVAFFALTLVNLLPNNNNRMPKLTAHVYITIIGTELSHVLESKSSKQVLLAATPQLVLRPAGMWLPVAQFYNLAVFKSRVNRILMYTLLMSQALFSLKPHAGFANNLKYPQKTKLSWLIQLLGSMLVIVGCIMAIVLIEQTNREISLPLPDVDFAIEEHFDSGHAIVGFIAMLLATVSMVGAFAHLFNQDLENNTILKAAQSCVSTVTLVLASIAICLILNDLRTNDTSSKTGMAFSILAIIGVFFMMVCNLAKGGRFLI